MIGVLKFDESFEERINACNNVKESNNPSMFNREDFKRIGLVDGTPVRILENEIYVAGVGGYEILNLHFGFLIALNIYGH